MARDRLLVISATLTLAFCIGANTTVFSVANSILVRPLPYPHSGWIDWISERSGPHRDDVGTAPDYYRLRDGNRVFESVGAFNTLSLSWTNADRPELLDAAAVSPSFFRVMGMQPLLGRVLAPGEEGRKAAPLAVISYGFWRTRLGSDEHVLGKTISLDRSPRTIIGVMPQGFDFPRGTQVWLPMALDEASERPILANKPIFTVSIVARRKRGVTPREAESDLSRIAFGLREEYKVFPTGFRQDLTVEASSLQHHLTGSVRPALMLLSATAALVLLIACANLANLLLAGFSRRQREIAVRLALGAGRGRIVRQVLRESLVLAAPGGVAGIALSLLAVYLLNATKPAILVRYPPILIDWTVLVFTLTLTVAASVLFGAAPAFSAARVNAHETLKSAALTFSGGVGSSRLRRVLIVAELAISLVLLVGVGLLARSYIALTRVELGFQPDHLLTFRVTPLGPFNRDNLGFYNEVLERLRALPFTRSAALLANVPLSDEDFYSNGRIRVVGRAMVPFQQRPVFNHMVVSPEFFETLGIPVKGGRVFDGHDAVHGDAVVNNYGAITQAPVVVNQAFVRRMFPNEDPLGQRLSYGPDQNSVTWTIVGVVGDVRGAALGDDAPAMIYRCSCDGSRLHHAALVVRTGVDPKSAIRAVEEQVHAVGPDLPVFDVKTMDERRALALAPEEFQLAVIGSFGAIALILAAAGVYGVVSYLVSLRTREIGIRVAMGAEPGDVLSMVLRETLVLALVAVAIGLGGAWALTGNLHSMLYGIGERDAVAFALAPLVLVLIVLIACWAPARTASRIDPMGALREL